MAEVVNNYKPVTPVLMSAENPLGWKLEELAAQLVHEMHKKCVKIDPECLAHDSWDIIHHNNMEIIERLSEIQRLQTHSMEVSDSIRENSEIPHPLRDKEKSDE